MPNISADRLKELEAQAEYWRKEAEARNERVHALEARIDKFDRILIKIEMAAEGIPLNQPPMDINPGMAFNGASFHDHTDTSRLTETERLEIVIDGLWNRNGELSCKLAAVIALCQFAREHKA